MAQSTSAPGGKTSFITPEFGRHLLDSGFRSDFIIKSRGKEWKVHREILTDRCDYFKTMLGGNWVEAATGMVELDDPVEVLACVLNYIYTQDYMLPVTTHQSRSQFCLSAGAQSLTPLSRPRICFWRDIDGPVCGQQFPMSPRVAIEKLVFFTHEFFIHALVSALADRLGVMIDPITKRSRLSHLADQRARMLSSCLHLSSFCEVLRLVFDTCPQGAKGNLREAMVEICLLNADIMEYKGNEKIIELLESKEWMVWTMSRKYKLLLNGGLI